MIKIGTCGFSFKDWKGTVYPEDIKNKDILPYYNRELEFNMVEIDVTYYTLVSQKAVGAWLDKTTGDFTFAVKCHRDMTLNEMGNVNPFEVDNHETFQRFITTFRPMRESGKMLTFLAQFGPVFFKNRNNMDYLLKFKNYFGDWPLTIEFRHKSWLSETQREDTFNFLKENDLGYAVVDEPKLRSLAPLIPKATNNLAYIRLHGRNKRWFDSGQGDRYDYLYSEEELTDFIPIIRGLEQRTKLTAVFFNNCHAGAALKNAIKLRQLLDMARIRYPKTDLEQLELPLS